MTMDRRSFVTTTAAAGGMILGAPAIHAAAKGKVYRTAIIGSGWWGKLITTEAMASGRVRMVAVADCDRSMADGAVKLIAEKSGETATPYNDFREMLKKEKPDLCIVATPDHWHPLIAIACAEAGAHVYVEKPVGHTILEGRTMVNAARGADRVMQVGTHRRLTPHAVKAREFVKEGGLGRIGMARCFVPAGGPQGPDKTPDEDPPDGLDWDMWLGPAPYHPYNRAIHPKRFRHFLDFANGYIGDWVHWTDQLLFMIGDDKYPESCGAVGGVFLRHPDARADAPDTLDVHWDFGDMIATWEHRQYGGNGAEKCAIGLYLYGEKGVLHVGWKGGMTFFPRRSSQPEIHHDMVANEPGQQNVKELWADFIDSIDNKRTPVCDIEIGHRSTTLSLLGILSWKLGRSVKWDGEKERCPGDDEANALLMREYRKPWVYPEV